MQEPSSEEVHGAIILAAGASSRMGTLKQVLPWKGTTLLQHSIDQVRASSFDEVVVVLGANRELVERQTDLTGVHPVFNPNWETGMASSLVAGLRGLLDLSPQLRSVLILLTDQPLLDFRFYNKLLFRYLKGETKIVSSSYSGQLGVPVLFDRHHFKELLALRGDKGARALLRSLADDVIAIDAGDQAVDLDTEEKYRHYYELFGR